MTKPRVDLTMPLQLVEELPLRYLLAAPPHRNGDPLPVLCFLHGYDEAAPVSIDVALTRHGPLRPDNGSLINDRFIVVAPQLTVGGDLWYRYHKEVIAIVRDVQAAYTGDARRTYLTGFSFGGNGVLDLALAAPELWAALWPVDPTRVPQQQPDIPVWLSIGAAARRRRRGFIDTLDLHEPREGDDHRVWLDELEDHVGCARRAYHDSRIYDWLLRHRRTEALTPEPS